MATVVLDHREQSLRQLFDAHCDGFSVKPLALGDLQVSYPSGAGWIAERKRVDDLAASLTDGRWKDQCGRLFAQTGSRVVIIVEGYLAMSEPMREKADAAYWNMVCRNVLAFRTSCVQNTFELLCVLVKKLEPGVSRQLLPGNGVEAPRLKHVQSKRGRNSEPTVVFTRILCSIPSISEGIAGKLVSEFKSLPRLQRALVGTEFPEIRVNAKQKIGRARLDILRRALCDPVGAAPVAKSPCPCRKGPVKTRHEGHPITHAHATGTHNLLAHGLGDANFVSQRAWGPNRNGPPRTCGDAPWTSLAWARGAFLMGSTVSQPSSRSPRVTGCTARG